jgi:hypothetical protein
VGGGGIGGWPVDTSSAWCAASGLVMISMPAVVDPGTKIANKILNRTDPGSKVAFKPAHSHAVARHGRQLQFRVIAIHVTERCLFEHAASAG